MNSVSALPFDALARSLGQRVIGGELSNDDAVRALVSEAVATGTVRRQIIRVHGGRILSHERDDFIAEAAFEFARYALPAAGRETPVDMRPFAEEGASATGWVYSMVRAFRPSRIERAYRSSRGADIVPLDDEHAEIPSPESVDGALEPDMPDVDAVDEAAFGRPAQGRAVAMIHASVLHQLLGGPALDTSSLSDVERRSLDSAIGADPLLPARAIVPGGGEIGVAAEQIRAMWASWAPDDVAEVIARSSEDRDIAGLLTRAALGMLPRPAAGARGSGLASLRARVRRSLAGVTRAQADRLLDAFFAARVSPFADKDTVRRPLGADESARRSDLAAQLPQLVSEVSAASGIPADDLISGLIGLLVDDIPVLDSRYFTPTTWRFP